MNLILTRKNYSLYGITGELCDESGKHLCFTLEHAYQVGATYLPKVAAGVYNCTRHPPNRLPYETFELQDVPPFQAALVSGILIHVGNYNGDSEGCILVGLEQGQGCILESKKAFDMLMGVQADVASFTLTVK